jgi:hypothetical protein
VSRAGVEVTKRLNHSGTAGVKELGKSGRPKWPFVIGSVSMDLITVQEMSCKGSGGPSKSPGFFGLWLRKSRVRTRLPTPCGAASCYSRP